MFHQKDSLLTESTKKGKEAHTVFNIFVAILLLIFMKMFYHDMYTKGHDFIDLTMIHDLFDDIQVCMLYWLPLFLSTFTVVFIVKYVKTRLLSGLCYTALQCFIFAFSIKAALKKESSPLMGMILTCEMARLAMKTHAYYREKLLHCTDNPYIKFVPEFAKKRGVTVEQLNLPKIKLEGLCIEIRKFNYFLWIPRLVYRDEYPRRVKRSKANLLANFITFNLCFYYTFAMLKGFINPTFMRYFQGQADFEELYTVCTVTGILFMVMAFFGVLHSWMNMFAEITRFGDREFYNDWWNVSNFGAYYRKWNIIVHEFLYYYVYNDSVRFTLGKITSGGSKFLVFFISALVHEIIIACTFKFFFPILLILFGGPGVFLMQMTTSNNRLLGILLWLQLIIGNGILIALYGLEYYTRLQPDYAQKVEEGGLKEFFIPQCYDYFMKRYG